MACLDADTVLAWIDGQIAEPRRAEVEQHLDTCGSCRRMLSAAAVATDVASAATRPSDGSLPTAATAHALPTIEPAVYVRLDEVGRGGLGRIVRAQDLRTGRVVAIKEMLATTADAGTRFVREALITANLMHPAIVPVYEVGRWPDGQPFYAMKLVRGAPLSDLLERCADVDARLAMIPHLVAIAEALAYAHGERVIHRDLKPHNVLCGPHGETVVIDWGLARRLDAAEPSIDSALHSAVLRAADDATIVGSVMGTPAYMAPEQARGERVDERADVYAIGAIAYRTLAGRPPYLGKTVDELLAAVRAGPPEPLRVLAPALPVDLVAIVERAMAREPGDRYASAGELAADLRRFATGQLVRAHRYTRTERARRFIARHAAAVAVATLAITAIAIGGAYAIRNVIAARDTAEHEQQRADRERDEARRRLALAYVDRARVELAAEHADRALAYAVAAVDAGATGPDLRFIAARALDELPAAHRITGKQLYGDAAFVPHTHDVLVNTEDELLRWSPERDTIVWRLPGAPGDNLFLDDNTVLVAHKEGVLVVDVATGKSTGMLPRSGHDDFQGRLATDPAKRWLAAPTTTGVELYDLTTRTIVASPTLMVAHGAEFVSPDGDRVLLKTGSPDNSEQRMVILDRAGKEVAEIGRHNVVVEALDDELVVEVTKDKLPAGIAIIDWSGRVRRRIDHHGNVKAFAIDRATRSLAVADHDGGLAIYDWATGAVRWKRTIRDAAQVIRFDAHGRLWGVGAYNSFAAFDVRTGVELGRWQVPGWGFVLSDDEREVVIVDPTKTIAAWPLAALPLAAILPGPTRTRLLALPEHGALAGGEDGAVTFVDDDGRAAPLGKLSGPVTGLTVAAGHLVLASARSMDSAIWDLADGREVARFKASIAELSPVDAHTIATGDLEGHVALYDPATHEATPLGRLGVRVRAVHWSPAGDRIGAISMTGEVGVWQRDGKLLRRIEATDDGVDLAFSPDGAWFVRAAKGDSTLHSSSDRARDRVLRDGPGDMNHVVGVAFTRDGARVVLAGDGYAGSWDVATGAPLASIATNTMTMGVVLSADGRLIYGAGLDGKIHVWDHDTSAEYLAVTAPSELYGLVTSSDGRRIGGPTLTAALVWTIGGFTGELAGLRDLVRCRIAKVVEAGVLRDRPLDPVACRFAK